MNKMAKNNKMPAIRFSGYTDAWEQCKLGELAEIVRGASPRPISDPKWFDNNSNVGWLRIADVTAQDGRIRYLEQKISELGQEKTRVIKTPHLLLSIAATVGKPVINYIPTGVHDGFLIFLNPKFNILYTFWWLEMFREKWNKYGQPGSQVNLNSDLVKNQVINIPNEKEQEKISSFLEALDKIITLHQRKLEKLKLTKKALLQKLFPQNGSKFPELRFKGFTDAWEQCKLGSLATVEMNKRIFKEQTTTKGDIPFYKIGTFGCDADSFISRDLFEEYKNKYPYPNIGDILISASGSIGRTVVYNGEDAYYQDSNIVWLNHNGKIDNSFLLQFYNQVKWAGLEGSTIKRLYNKNILETYIAVPKIEEQRLIGEFFKLVDSSITLHQRKLDMLKNVKKGLLQKMFV